MKTELSEIMCQNLFTGRIVQNVVKIIILFVFSLPWPQNMFNKLLEKTIFSSVFFFYFLGLRDLYFPEIRFVKGLKNLAFLPRADNSVSPR